jgi:D-hydroxyproline dehydrogenase subunit gamma
MAVVSSPLRLPDGHGLARGTAVTVLVDGAPVTAYEGETVATVLIADGEPAIRRTRKGSTRGLFCGIGVCFECLAVVDGIPNTRACMTFVRDGMTIEHQDGFTARQ